MFCAATLAIAALVLGWDNASSTLAVGAAAGSIALIAASCEVLPLRIDDNLTIPLFVGFGTWIIGTLFGLPLT